MVYDRKIHIQSEMESGSRESGARPEKWGAPQRAYCGRILKFVEECLLIQNTVSRWCSSGCVNAGCGVVHRWLQNEEQALLDFLL